MARRTPQPTIHLVLETSGLFTDAADRLIKAELSEFILETITKKEVTVSWYVPEIVIAERTDDSQS